MMSDGGGNNLSDDKCCGNEENPGLGNKTLRESDTKSFRLKQDDRFFSKIIAKEASEVNSSSRVFYYGQTSVAVPFTWEEKPGTPKHPLSETSLPPLTPPPSYHTKTKSKNKGRNSKLNIFSCILQRFSSSRKSTNVSSFSSPSSFSSSSSSSTWSMVYPSYSNSIRDRNKGSFSLSGSTTVSSFLKHKASNRVGGCYPFSRNIKNTIVSHEQFNYEGLVDIECN
ncbi:uncharacterized protein LOC130733527 isoform X2 [Lotus japonicus]|uniref:uncharacterized protein LOC130733527 isoform X2 n=1 Tax=Lotus japonicus TaxID=34305 RepID=UPI002585A232|nr:uncharacterized protein LOC130733527 isoform X2 [Lotus japonicus]